jgi:Tol biopolymer transport system component
LLADLKRLRGDSESGRTAKWRWSFVTALVGIIATLLVVGLLVDRRLTMKASLAPVKLVPFANYAGTEGHPTFSPDGTQIAFMWNGGEGDNFDLYVKIIGDSTALRLTKSSGASHPGPPVWSPDGHSIAFARCADTSGGIFAVSPLGGPERKIAESRSCSWDLDWTPDGKSIVLSDKDSGDEPEGIFLLSPESGQRRRLTKPARPETDFQPKVSPDGNSVAFVRAHGVITQDIFVVSVAGGQPRRLTFKNSFFNGLTWTRDGKEIIFTSDNLWRINVNGGTPERVAEVAAADASEPAVSRQGYRLAYRQVSANVNIWQIRLPSGSGRPSAPVKLISSTREQSAPQYSPDGKRITFDSNRSGSPQVWVSDSDGSNPVN